MAEIMEEDPVDFATLRNELERDEGRRLKVYVDSVGKRSIGIGRNLDDVGISEEEANFLLDNDIERAIKELNRFMPWWVTLTHARRHAMINLMFNMGPGRLLGFKKALTALKDGDYAKAADEFLDSKWAGQVGERAHRIANMIRGEV